MAPTFVVAAVSVASVAVASAVAAEPTTNRHRRRLNTQAPTSSCDLEDTTSLLGQFRKARKDAAIQELGHLDVDRTENLLVNVECWSDLTVTVNTLPDAIYLHDLDPHHTEITLGSPDEWAQWDDALLNAPYSGRDGHYPFEGYALTNDLLRLAVWSQVAAESWFGPIELWNVAQCTDMSDLFVLVDDNFNEDLSAWDTSSVTDMNGMFENKVGFNQPIGNWDTSQVTSMRSMFQGANVFDQDLTEWDVSSVTDMERMFQETQMSYALCWDLAHVEHHDKLFDSVTAGGTADCPPWNDNMITSPFTGNGGGSSTFVPYQGHPFEYHLLRTAMYHLDNAQSYFGPTSTWNVSEVTSLYNILSLHPNVDTFNEDLSGWNVHKVTDFRKAFLGGLAFNADLSGWDTSSATTMEEMFFAALAFNQDLSGWNTAQVTSFEGMFQHAHSFDQDLDAWDTSSLQTTKNMFADAVSFQQALCWDTRGITTTDMFDGAPGGSISCDVTAQADAYVRCGSYQNNVMAASNPNELVVKADANISFRRFALVQLDVNHNFDPTDRQAMLRLYVLLTGSTSSRDITISKVDPAALAGAGLGSAVSLEANATCANTESLATTGSTVVFPISYTAESLGGEWVSVDISSLLEAHDQVVTLKLSNEGPAGSQTTVVFASREHVGLGPQLDIDFV